MLIFVLLSSSPSFSFNLLSSSSCSPHHFLHHSFFLKFFLKSILLSAVATLTPLPSVSYFFLLKLPFLFSLALLSHFYLFFFHLYSSQGQTSPPTPPPFSSLSLAISTSPLIISSFFLFPAELVTAPFSSHQFTSLLIFTFGCSTFIGGKMCRLLSTFLWCPSLSLLSQALLHLGKEGWRATPTGQSGRCVLALRGAQQIR